MTMHLVRGMSTLSTRKRKQSGITQRDRDAQAAHDRWLRSQGLHPSQLKDKLRGVSVNAMPNYKSDTNCAPTSDVIGPVQGKRKANVYTGNEIAGIGMLHKSNLIPVRKDSNAAKELASMRR